MVGILSQCDTNEIIPLYTLYFTILLSVTLQEEEEERKAEGRREGGRKKERKTLCHYFYLVTES